MSVFTGKNITKRFGKLTAVDKVDIQINEGEVVGMIGPNGAGKTTLVNLLSGTLRPDEGEISYQGENITTETEHARARLGIARSFQIPQIYDESTVHENILASILTREGGNLKLLDSFRNWKEYSAEAQEILDQFGLKNQSDLKAEQIPHGQRKILDVATSVALQPTFLILDEPTSGVNSSDKNIIMKRIIENTANEERGIMFVSHDMELIRNYSTRAIALDQGSVLVEGDVDEVLTDAKVKARIRGET
jgi:branched-chain amino acid transport system ATP-binding protein